MVDSPEPAIGQEHVAALAVRVVGHHIESSETTEPGVVRRVVSDREVVVLHVFFDEELDRAWTEGSLVSRHGDGDEVEAEPFAQDIGGNLAAPQAAREIP